MQGGQTEHWVLGIFVPFPDKNTKSDLCMHTSSVVVAYLQLPDSLTCKAVTPNSLQRVAKSWTVNMTVNDEALVTTSLDPHATRCSAYCIATTAYANLLANT